MPLYCYKCKDCEYQFEVRHSMHFEDQNCKKCQSPKVFRIPSISVTKKFFAERKPGEVVKDYIENAKKEIKKEKNIMKKDKL